jgi:hypothetical protein
MRRMPAPRYPFIARVCLWLNATFALLWALYLLGPDVGGILLSPRGGVGYRIFAGTFFVAHFVLISTGIIALFVVIIEVYGRRPVRGFRSVLLAMALPIASFLYFAVRFLTQVQRWGASQGWDGR